MVTSGGARPPARLTALLTGILLLVGLLATATPAGAVVPYRGATLHSLWFDGSNADMDRELDLLAAAGANAARVDVNWSSLETDGRGRWSAWYLEKLDRFMAGSETRGLKVIATLWASPCWASSAPDSLRQGCAGEWWRREVTNYPPADSADYARVAEFLTARYGTKLAGLEIWNEPNLSAFWNVPDKAARYAELVKATYPAAKRGDPAVPVLAGAMAFADRPFLEQLYAQGIAGSYDGISLHPYNEGRAPGDRWRPEWRKTTFLPGIEWIRDAQRAVGDSTPLWLTEFGWTSGTGSDWRVTEAQQATFVEDAFRIADTLPYLAAASVYNLRDKGTDPSSHEDNFGLLRRDFTPKPAYAAFARALHGETGDRQPPSAASAGRRNAPAIAGAPATPAVAVPRRTRAARTGRSRGKGRPDVTLEVRHRGRTVYARGKTRGTRVVQLVVLSGSRRAGTARAARAVVRTIVVRTNGHGRFKRRLGSFARLRGCRVVARILAAA